MISYIDNICNEADTVKKRKQVITLQKDTVRKQLQKEKNKQGWQEKRHETDNTSHEVIRLFQRDSKLLLSVWRDTIQVCRLSRPSTPREKKHTVTLYVHKNKF